MLREQTTPIFLWITTAVLLHIVGYGGSERVVTRLEAHQVLRDFVGEIVREARRGPEEIEVALLDEPPEDPPPPDPDEPPPDEPPAPDRPPLLPEPKPPELPDELPDELAKEPKPPEPKNPNEPAPPQQLVIPPMDRRVAVVQHVDDPDQEDNPNARFIADQANHVAEESQASITATDRNDPVPSPGKAHLGPVEEPGDSDESRVAQSEDLPGEADQAPAPLPASLEFEVPPPPPPAVPPGAAAPLGGSPPPAPAPARGSPEHRAVDAVDATPGVVGARDGSWDGLVERAARPAESARPRRLPPPSRPKDLLGFGRMGTTASGVNLNLSPTDLREVVGADQLSAAARKDGERRRSAHRGSWSSLGIDRWRASIENYVASVKPGNQTALNTAKVPFSSYLNHVHNRIHPIFADSFLVSLDALPASHPLNRWDLVTFLEIVVDRDEGRLVRMGVTKTSGVTAFDVAALESVSAAAPFGRPPSMIVSPDGNVYFHWEFHRNPIYACSTYNARPFILKTKPKPAVPDVPPPRRPGDVERDQRHGTGLRVGRDRFG
ncbi:MAG: hypothetical protein JW751_15250 [Polyangiaceae bacterium]|nr:hypothetical protein [Polyangiaceae bacterium]